MYINKWKSIHNTYKTLFISVIFMYAQGKGEESSISSKLGCTSAFTCICDSIKKVKLKIGSPFPLQQHTLCNTCMPLVYRSTVSRSTHKRSATSGIITCSLHIMWSIRVCWTVTSDVKTWFNFSINFLFCRLPCLYNMHVLYTR